MDFSVLDLVQHQGRVLYLYLTLFTDGICVPLGLSGGTGNANLIKFSVNCKFEQVKFEQLSFDTIIQPGSNKNSRA